MEKIMYKFVWPPILHFDLPEDFLRRCLSTMDLAVSYNEWDSKYSYTLGLLFGKQLNIDISALCQARLTSTTKWQHCSWPFLTSLLQGSQFAVTDLAVSKSMTRETVTGWEKGYTVHQPPAKTKHYEPNLHSVIMQKTQEQGF